ncbi:unnamed protein product [Hermetia illucens]|uniref:GTP cyclohydrolase 1 feedback regulatory protein n=1 Tax=Hermetia illucens TaxID=343691 RepID=A0A7R8YN16_HERIL|nr:uncharacterized protein LOC119646421 [Hermetia illucens]CAD7079206.1 unnamed protein product [Hermetia illucens]
MDSQQSQPQNLQQQQPLPPLQTQLQQQQPIIKPQSPPPSQSQPPTPQACATNVVIPVPIVPPEDIYTYVVVKGSLHAQDCAIFGLNEQETAAFTKRYTNGSTEIVNGILIKIPPLQAINSLSQLGYKVVCSTGEAEIVWTMQREL